jgi:transcriptional regulator with XRE-family HTH domain
MKKIRPILRDFGERVRFLRKAAGLTQEELAERSKLHPTYIGQVERGERNLSLTCIEKLATGLGIEIKELFVFPEKERKEQDELRYKVKAIVNGMDIKSLTMSEKILKYITEGK